MAVRTLLLRDCDARLQLYRAASHILDPQSAMDLSMADLLVELNRASRTMGRALLGNPRSGKEAIRLYLVLRIGEQVSSEHIDAISGIGDAARRVRELRDSDGAPILCGSAINDDERLLLEETEFGRVRPDHYVLLPGAWYPGRKVRIATSVRLAVLSRDGLRCSCCGWSPVGADIMDRRRLEAHHVLRPEDGGADDADNLATLCTKCHAGSHSRTQGRGKLVRRDCAPRPAKDKRVATAAVPGPLRGQPSFLF
jgi:hypothetical protein